MWRLCLAPLLAASALGLRSRDGVLGGLRSAAPGGATCEAFPGKQVVMVTVSSDFMQFFENWLHFAGPYLTSSEQVVAFAEDAQVVPMLRRFLHEGAATPFKIAVSAVKPGATWFKKPEREVLILAAGLSSSQDMYEIDIQDAHPYQSWAYKKLVSQRPSQLRHFLDQNCSVLYSDIDNAWLQNPFDSIRRAGDYEMYVTDDKRPGEGLTSDYLCSCFLYMHPTSNVKAMVRRWEFLQSGVPKLNQWKFNDAFHEIRRSHPGFAVALPRVEFPPGGPNEFLVVNSTVPTVLHANGIGNSPEKVAYLKKYGAWHLKERRAWSLR